MNTPAPAATPLVVDLDGTLIRGDLLCEALFRLLRQRPWRLLHLLPALLRGRAALKARLAQEVQLPVERLPWNQAVVEFIRTRREQGQPIWLATAADRRFAEAVARHLGLFERVFASAPGDNLKGQRKYDALRRAAPAGFDYIGDARADGPVLAGARRGWTVGPAAARLARQAGAHVAVLPGSGPAGGRTAGLLQLIRPHQWLKNALAFLPLVAAHQWHDTAAVAATAIVFAAFCLVASAAYVLNDLLDIEHDRRHPRKRARPLAAGTVSQPLAVLLVPILLFAAAAFALHLPWPAVAVLFGYFVLTTLYSVYLKRITLVDILALTLLYNLRILGGAVAAGILLSYWLVGFTLLLFLALATMKRVNEVQALHGEQREMAAGRGYAQGDERLLLPLGIGCSVAATAILGLYTISDHVAEGYSDVVFLGALVPVVLLWQGHLWLATIRGAMHDDPLVYAVRDGATWVAALLVIALFVAAL